MDAQIWLCGHGETKDNTVLCLINAIKRVPYQLDIQYHSGDALIGRSRSIAAYKFLKSNVAPYMVFIDTDIMFTPEELEKLIKSMLEGYDVIGGAYSVASGDKLAIKAYTSSIALNGSISEIEYISTGFMGISRKCLETMVDKLKLPLLHKGAWCECYPFFESGRHLDPNLNEEFYLSEDWDFCNKAREAGFKVYLHTGCLVDHFKSIPIVCEEVLSKTKIDSLIGEAPGQDLIRDLAEYLDKPFKEVQDRVINDRSDKIKSTDEEWLYDLAQFNTYKYYQDERLFPLSNLKGHNILDYGCGIGSASFYVSRGNLVTGYDINPECIRFANYRLKKYGSTSRIHFTNEKPDLKEFDIVLFIDVLEHIEKLEEFMVDLGKQLKKGVRLYHFNTFWQKLPEHYDHSKEWPEIMEKAGFIRIDLPEDKWSVKT